MPASFVISIARARSCSFLELSTIYRLLKESLFANIRECMENRQDLLPRDALLFHELFDERGTTLLKKSIEVAIQILCQWTYLLENTRKFGRRKLWIATNVRAYLTYE